MDHSLEAIENLTEADLHLINNTPHLDDIAAIVFYGRSGSIFLQSLFDSHPQVITVPGVSLMYYFKFWDTFENLPKDRLISKFCDYFASLFDVLADDRFGEREQPAIKFSFDKMGENRDEKIEINKNKFIQLMRFILKDNTAISRKLFFQAFHVAYTIAADRSPNLDKSRLPVIVFQLHAATTARTMKLCADFPKTKIIHTIREPLQTTGSAFNYIDKEKRYLYNSVAILKCSYYHAFPPTEPERSRAVRLEDLHIQPKQTLTKLIRWLGLDWHDNLLKSTFNDKKWWNIRGTVQVSGFNNVIIAKNHSELYYKIDIHRLKILYHKRFKLWNYSDQSISKSKCLVLFPLLFVPFKMEKISWQYHLSMKGKWKGMVYALGSFIRLRKVFIKAWIYSLTNKINEVKLL